MFPSAESNVRSSQLLSSSLKATLDALIKSTPLALCEGRFRHSYLHDLPVIMYTDILLLALATSTFLLYRWITASRMKLPPGPPADPFIGNLRQMASFDSQQETFAEWGKVFGKAVIYAHDLASRSQIVLISLSVTGDVMHARIFGRSMIILNSFRAARDLMEKRSLNYSCRPRLVLIAEM